MSGSRSVARGDQKVEPVSTSDVFGAHHSWTAGGLTENVQETFPLQCWICCELSLMVSFLITNESVMPPTASHQWWCSVQQCSHVILLSYMILQTRAHSHICHFYCDEHILSPKSPNLMLWISSNSKNTVMLVITVLLVTDKHDIQRSKCSLKMKSEWICTCRLSQNPVLIILHVSLSLETHLTEKGLMPTQKITFMSRIDRYKAYRRVLHCLDVTIAVERHCSSFLADKIKAFSCQIQFSHPA